MSENRFVTMRKLSKGQAKMTALVLVVLVSASVYCYAEIGAVTLFLIAVPGIFAFLFWYLTYLREPTDP